MRRATTIFWILTGLAAAFMLAASIPDVLQVPGAVATFAHLGFPPYLVPFIGLAKILGAVVILLPTFQVLKEWAYAGLVFDLTGALYSHICVGDRPSDPMHCIGRKSNRKLVRDTLLQSENYGIWLLSRRLMTRNSQRAKEV